MVSLGKLSDQEADQWRSLLKLAKQPKSAVGHPPVIISNHAYLDVATILETWNSWELNTVFDKPSKGRQRKVPLSAIAALLTINRCIDPTSKSQVPAWAQQTAINLLLNISNSEVNPSRIFRELISIEECKDALIQHLYKKVNDKNPASTNKLFYDLSSTTFSGSRCMLMNWGHCKEGYANHVVLALIVNTEGIPIYWEVLKGCTADATTISWLLNRLKKKLNTTAPIMVFDRGMVSEDNLSLLEVNHVKYISAMDKNQIESIADINFKLFQKMTEKTVDKEMKKKKDCIQLDENTYCKETCTKENRRYILCFNAQLFKDQRNARKQHLEELNSFVKIQNEDLSRAKKNRSKQATQKKFDSQIRKLQLQGFVTVKLIPTSPIVVKNSGADSVQSYHGKIHVSKRKEQEIGRLDGFWLLVTNLSEKDNKRLFVLDTKSVVQPYQDKVIIESSFRDIKSFVDISPVYVWKEEHVKAHYTLSVC